MSPELLIEPHYFGSIAFFSAIASFEVITLDGHSHYIKQTYRNRCNLLTPQGVKPLTIPVHYRNHMPLEEVRVDYQQNWVKIHLGMLQSAYGKSPFFDYYFPEIQALLESRHSFLFDLAFESLTSCLNWLQIDRQLRVADSFTKSVSNGIIDARDAIHPKKSDRLSDFYEPIPYFQNFGSNFVKNLSVLDCLMNCGPECIEIIKKSQSTH